MAEAIDDTEQSAQPDSEQGMVDVHEASIQDLDAALVSYQEQEVSESEAAEDDSSNPQKPTEQPSGDVKAKPQEVAPQGAEPAKPAKTYTQEEIQGILAENERQKKEGNQKELFIQHRNNELGQVRAQLEQNKRQLAEVRQQLVTGLDDRFAESPAQAIKDSDRIKEIDQQLEVLNQKEVRAAKIVEAQTFFLKHVDTDAVSIDDVSAVLSADGVDDRYVAQFKANPWEFTTPEALVQMGKRAMERKAFTEADSDRRTLARHILHLNQEIVKLKQKPGQVMSQVQRHLNQAPPLTARSSVSAKSSRDVDPTRMTTAELDAALRNATSH